MPRNASGTYSAPTGNPVVTGTAISSTVHNATVADIATEITDSLSRSGKGGMLVPLGFSDGIVSAPGITLTSEDTSGIYRAGAGDVRFAILGVDVWSWVKSGATYLAKVLGTALGVDLIQPVTANTTITVKGNRTDVSTGADLTVNTSATRTAGSLLAVQNNGTDKFVVDYNGEPSVMGGLACGRVSVVDFSLGAVLSAVTGASFDAVAGGVYVAEYSGTVLGSGGGSTFSAAFTKFGGVDYAFYDITQVGAAAAAATAAAAAISTEIGGGAFAPGAVRHGFYGHLYLKVSTSSAVSFQARDAGTGLGVLSQLTITWRRIA